MGKKFIIMLGPPGSGKGTQGKLLAKVINFAYFSMGAVLRDYSRGDSEEAKFIKETIDGGRIIPDDLIKQIFEGQLKKYSDSEGIIIDGFPRDIAQVDILNDNIKKYNASTRVIFLDVPKEKLLERINERNAQAVEKRADDDPNLLHTRFEEYLQKTLPLVDYFQKAGILFRVEGNHPIEEVHQNILKQLGV